MAKVLACPACGNKHPLELLAGLDSFLCKNCGKKLAVPMEASAAIKTVSAKPSIRTTQNSAPEKVDSPQNDKIISDHPDIDANEDVVVVARSSMPADVEVGSDAISKVVAPQVVAKSSVTEAPVAEPKGEMESLAPKKNKIGDSKVASYFKDLAGLSTIHIPFVGLIASWLVAIPAGFFIVVIMPRFFGYGFHASDFVGVITNQGISRYKIVVALIFLWSVSTVICVSLFNLLVRKLFLARKLAA